MESGDLRAGRYSCKGCTSDQGGSDRGASKAPVGKDGTVDSAQAVLDAQPAAQRLRIPMRPDNRSLNLSNAVAVIAYEAWRQLDYAGGG